MSAQKRKPAATITYQGFVWKPFFNIGGRGGAALWLNGKPWISAETDPARQEAAMRAIGG